MLTPMKELFPILKEFPEHILWSFMIYTVCCRNGKESLTPAIVDRNIVWEITELFGNKLPPLPDIHGVSYHLDLESCKTNKIRLYTVPMRGMTNLGYTIENGEVTEYKEYTNHDDYIMNKRFDAEYNFISEHKEYKDGTLENWTGRKETYEIMKFANGSVPISYRTDADQTYLHGVLPLGASYHL